MPKKTMAQAINEALRQEMERDANVIVIGEDVAGGKAGSSGVRDQGFVFPVRRYASDRYAYLRVGHHGYRSRRGVYGASPRG